MISLDEKSVARRRLSGLLETQLRDLTCDLGIDEHVGAAAEPSGIARTIVQYTRNSDELWARLLIELDRLAPVRLKCDGTLTLTRHDEAKLLGLLRPFWKPKESWLKTAVVLARGNIFLDRNLPWELENLISHLTVVPSSVMDPTELPLIRFVILLRDIATKRNAPPLALDLHDWLKSIVQGSEFDLDSIASKTIPLPAEAVWEPALELAWKPSSSDKFPEAYLRWGNLRQRVELPVFDGSPRAQVTSVCELIENDEFYVSVVGHVEISVTMNSIAEPWELKSASNLASINPKRIKWPVTVRLCRTCETIANRECLDCELDATRVNTSVDEAELTGYSVTHGFFVAMDHAENGVPSNAFYAAARSATAAIWTRRSVRRFEFIQNSLSNKRIYDLPKFVHDLRETAGIDSDWRHLVLLYDPNLPPFEFAVSETTHKESDATSLYAQINNQL